jgi:hypothetical protein
MMNSENNAPPAHELYSRHIDGTDGSGIAPRLWGPIPQTMGNAYKLLVKKRADYGPAHGELEELKKAMKDNLRRLGILTSMVTDGIDHLDRGVIETGQQPMCLGGPSLVLNKIAYIHSLSNLGDEGFTPLFYVADYDGVQPELLNIRLPSPSSRGLVLSYPVGQGMENAPIYRLGNPPEDWLRETLERIEGNLKGVLGGVGVETQSSALRNLAHATTVLKSTYYSTENVSEWSTKILGTLVNLEACLGGPIYAFSMQVTRHLFQGGYELLLGEPNRSRFIEASNEACELVETSGFRSGIGLREKDYVPFFLECPHPGCNGARVELKYRRSEGSPTASVSGRCAKCGETHEHSFNAGSPDLTEMISYINPRVDSRQVIVDSVIPVLAHVGGPGETSYYAEVIPAAEAIGIPFPVYLRYTRTFYNTPWSEAQATRLKDRGHPTLADSELFPSLGKWVEARNSSNVEGLRQAHEGIKTSIEGTFSELLKRLEALQSDVEAIKARLSESGDRRPLIEEMREKQGEAKDIEQYLSTAFGRFSPEKFGQEVNWAWLDLVAVSDIKDLVGVYLREYNRNTPNSSIFYVNL